METVIFQLELCAQLFARQKFLSKRGLNYK
jgi:hypothetical protein